MKCFLLLLVLSAFCCQAAVELLGAGATFPYPLYSKYFDAYNQKTGHKINYQAIGSGGGIKQLISRTVDFGGTDAYLTPEEKASAGADILHIPTCLGSVVLTYNIPGNPTLKLSPDIIADIFLGKIQKWDDARIAADNPGVKLPTANIITVHRSDGSGTTSIFSDYLTKISPEWAKSVGAGKSLNWPSGLGAKGNAGCAALIKSIPGSMGYTEFLYAYNNKMPIAEVKNRSGRFIVPSIESTSLSADVSLPDDTCVSLVDTDAADGYPISGFTWLIFYREQNYSGKSLEKVTALLDLFWWIIHEGQGMNAPLHYSPLPQKAVIKAENILKSVVFDGKPVLNK